MANVGPRVTELGRPVSGYESLSWDAQHRAASPRAGTVNVGPRVAKPGWPT